MLKKINPQKKKKKTKNNRYFFYNILQEILQGSLPWGRGLQIQEKPRPCRFLWMVSSSEGAEWVRQQCLALQQPSSQIWEIQVGLWIRANQTPDSRLDEVGGLLLAWRRSGGVRRMELGSQALSVLQTSTGPQPQRHEQVKSGYFQQEDSESHNWQVLKV